MGGYYCVFSIFFIQTNPLFTLKYELQILDDLVKDNNDSNNEVALVIENLKKTHISLVVICDCPNSLKISYRFRKDILLPNLMIN